MASTNFISQQSVSLRESKGRIETNIADAMGFNAYNGGGKFIVTAASTGISTFMSASGSGFSAGSGNSVGSGKNFSVLLQNNVTILTNFSGAYSKAYNVSAGSGFSNGSGNSQYVKKFFMVKTKYLIIPVL